MELSSRSAGRYEMPENGTPAHIAVQIVEDDLGRDIIPAYNLAGFATTYMENEAEQLMLKNISKNITHVEAYPAANEIEKRCIDMIARIFNAPLESPESEAVGLSTLGSSEAVMLSVIAAKHRWQSTMRAAGRPTARPNMVMSSAVHVCWKKAALYFEVEERYCECTSEQTIDPHEAVDLVDENTILVCAIMGTTYLGNYEDVQKLNDLLQEKNITQGLNVMIHVDAASGGFVAPFTRPNLIWDFRLPLVCSINTSGHKYGLTYAAVGWAVWRSKLYLPERLLFYFDYCGSHQISFTLNFSKSSMHILGQYYQLIRLGISGYRSVMAELTKTADSLAKDIVSVASGSKFVLMSKTGGNGLPIVVWRLKNEAKYDEFTIARQLRLRGLFVPAYSMATKLGQLKLLRIVVRKDFSTKIYAAFIRSLQEVIENLDSAFTEY